MLNSYDYTLIDLNMMSDNRIRAIENLFVASALLFQKHIFDVKGLIEALQFTLMELDAEEHRNFIKQTFVYIITQLNYFEINLTEVMNSLPTTTAQKEFKSLYDHLIEEGEKKGRQQGLQQSLEQGLEQGITQTLTKSIHRGYYKLGLTVEQLALQNDITEQKVKEILNIKMV